MADFTIEQQRALAIARARVRAQTNAAQQQRKKPTATSSYFQTDVAPVEFQAVPFAKAPLPKGTTTKEIAKRYDVDKYSRKQDFQPTPNDGRPQAVLTNPTPGVIPLDQQTVDTLIDFENDEGYFDRLASYYRQGLSPLESGATRLRSAITEFEAENPLPWTSPESIARSRAIADAARRRAAQEEVIGNAPIAGSVGLEEVVANPLDVTQYGEAFANLAATSLPYMFGAKFAPVITTAALAGSGGQQRAENNMQQDATLRDIALASPGAIASMALERLGVERIIGAEGANAFTRALKAGAGEGVSETGSSLAEYTGSTLGTERGFSPEEAARQAGYGLLGGAILGGGLRGGYELGAKALGIKPADRPAPTPPPPPPPPPPAAAAAPAAPAVSTVPVADLSNALGPVGGKITLQEPSGPQEYTYQGIDEDGSVLLADAEGLIYAEDPDQIAAAMKSGVAESEAGLGAVAFGEDITEGLPEVDEEAAPAPPISRRDLTETIANYEAAAGTNLPLDEGIPAQLKAMERDNTPSYMANLEREARQIAADQSAPSVSSEHFSQALNNAATRTAGTGVPFAGDWQQATPKAAPAPERVRTVTTPGGSKVNTAFEVVDAKDLTAATGDLQNRDRSRAATDVQVQDIFSNFDPERLGESLESDRGSPIIGPDNVIESGNGRVMAINKVYEESPERADAYRQFIEAQGFDTSGMERPVLVRRRIDNLTPEARSQFVRESNMDTKLRLSTSEQAATDAAALTPDVMALMASPDVNQAVNRDFVRGFLSKLPVQEQAAFLDKNGNLSAEGSRRLRTAIKASAYGDADLINTLDESQDNNIKSIGGALEDVAPSWRAMRDAVSEGRVRSDMDVTDQLVEAAKIVRDVRNSGQKINDFLAQQDAFNPLDPVTERFIRSFYNQKSGRASGREAIGDILDKYARRAQEQTTEDQLFAAEPLSPEQVLDGIAGEKETDLFNDGKGVADNQQVSEVLSSGSPADMKNAIAKADKPDDKIMNERANLQKQNRGCD